MASSLSPLGAAWLGGGCFPLLPARESCGRRQMAPLHLAAQVKEGESHKSCRLSWSSHRIDIFLTAFFSRFSFSCFGLLRYYRVGAFRGVCGLSLRRWWWWWWWAPKVGLKEGARGVDGMATVGCYRLTSSCLQRSRMVGQN